MRNYKQLTQGQRYQIEAFKGSRKKPEKDSGVAGRIRINRVPGIEA
jgi:hypothetical protein